MLKCFAFVECLPEEDKARAKCFIIKEHVSFDVLVERFNEENHGLLPRWAHEKKWRESRPKSRKWKDLLTWWKEWNLLAKRVGNLTEVNLIERFDYIMLKYHSRCIRKIHEFEVTGRRFNLEERWNYLVQSVKNDTYIGYISHEYEKGDTSDMRRMEDEKTCYNCGRHGHVRRECPVRSRVVQRTPRRSGSETSRSSQGRHRNFRSRSTTRSFSSGSRSSYRSRSGQDRQRSYPKSPRYGQYRKSGQRQRTPGRWKSNFGRTGRSHSFNRRGSRSSWSSRSSGRSQQNARPERRFSRSSSGSHRSGYRSDRKDFKRNTPRTPKGIPDKKELIKRAQDGRCLFCNEKGHRVRECPKKRTIKESDHSKVRFQKKVRSLNNDSHEQSWEGDAALKEVDQYIHQLEQELERDIGEPISDSEY